MIQGAVKLATGPCNETGPVPDRGSEPFRYPKTKSNLCVADRGIVAQSSAREIVLGWSGLMPGQAAPGGGAAGPGSTGAHGGLSSERTVIRETGQAFYQIRAQPLPLATR